MKSTEDNSWKTLNSEIVYHNKWYAVRRDEVTRPDGKPGEYNVIEVADGAFVIALDTEENIHLIGKFRYTTNQFSIELPAGGIHKGETPLAAAKRELQEELGLSAKHWQSLGKFQAENAYMNNFAHVFIATDLTETGRNQQLAEGITKTQKVPLEQALEMLKNGQFTDSQSMSALTLAALHLGFIVKK